MAEDCLGFRFASFDDMVFKDDEDAAREESLKLMNEIGFGEQTKEIGYVEPASTDVMLVTDLDSGVNIMDGSEFFF